MKKAVKILISIIICVSVLLSLVSCNLLDAINDFLNRNKAGPGTTWADVYDYMWVETYDEMLEIVERTRAYGTEIPQIPVFSCEQYGLDIKFAITVENRIFDELEDKYEYFDRKIKQFSAVCYVFFESVTIEDVEQYISIPYLNNCVYSTTVQDRRVDSPEGVEYIEIEESHKIGMEKYYSVKYKGKNQFYLVSYYTEITEEQIEILEKTLTIIE